MSLKKGMVLMFITLLLICSLLSGCGSGNMQSRDTPQTFLEIIGDENLDDISLTIFFLSPYVSTRIPLSIDDLINFPETSKIVVNGEKLGDHVDLLNQLANTDLVPVEGKVYINARVYYVFESKTSGKIFEVAMWGAQLDDESNYIEPCIIVNGIAINVNEIFYDVIIPFLPEDAVKELEIYIGRRTWDE